MPLLEKIYLMSKVLDPGKVQMVSVKSWLLLKIQHFSFHDNSEKPEKHMISTHLYS